MRDDDEIVGEDLDPNEVMGDDKKELVEKYLNSGYSIDETAEELGLDKDDLKNEYGDVYDDN